MEPQRASAPYPTSTNQPDDQKYVSAEVKDRSPSPPPNGLLMSAAPGAEPVSAWASPRQLAHKFWVLEACASLLSLFIFAAIIGLLAHYDKSFYGDASNAQANGKKRPTIFALLSFLSTIMRATMLLPVATAIGQLKWSWFRTGRRLLDMERFDEAARGILGSAKLMWTLRFRNLAAVGAALTILALPLDAVIQSAVLLPSKLEANLIPSSSNITNETSIARAVTYNEWQTMESADKPWPETSLINAIRFGESYGNGLSDLIEAVTKVDCPTGYCTFLKAQTLAIRSKCADRTKSIETVEAKGDQQPYLTLPGTDLTLYYNGNETYEQQIIEANSYKDYPDEKYEKDVFGTIDGPLIVRTAMLINVNTNDTLGIECALYWYVETTTEYLDATTLFKLDATNDDIKFNFTSDAGNGYMWELTPDKCFVEGKVVPADKSDNYIDQCVFGVGNKTGQALGNMLMDPNDGFVGDSWLKSTRNDSNEWTRTNTFITNIYEATTNKNTTTEAFEEYETVWQNIAFATSFTVRRAPTEFHNGTTQRLLTTGMVFRPIYYYEIDWVRLTMPAFIILCCAMFVLYTALITQKEYAWRRSALPLLFHGIEDRERNALGDIRDFTVMQDVAKNMHVKLVEHVDANGARFTAQH